VTGPDAGAAGAEGTGGGEAGGGEAARPVDVAVVDDHPMILDGITGWVTVPDSGIRVVATAATVDAVLAGAGRRADVVLLDLDLGDGTTPERNVAAILAAGPAVLVVSASDSPAAVRAAMRAGARGYVLKNEEAAELRAAVRAVAAGTDWVSPRLAYIFATDDAPDRPALSAQETRTLRLYATGMPIKSVARRLSISEETARQYVRRVREKYSLANRAAPTKVDLYHRAVEDGHLPSPPSRGTPPRGQG
jgi:two-component system, NarL family, nitrate/nitrite response regulator NarL